MLEIRVPNIGDFDEVEVVEILVAKGERVEFDDPLVSIESDKATMEIPSSAAGIVSEVKVAEGDKVSEGSILVVLEIIKEETVAKESQGLAESDDGLHDAQSDVTPHVSKNGATDVVAALTTIVDDPPARAVAEMTRELSPAAANPVPDRSGLPHASPLVRRAARELGVPIGDTVGTGAHGRILEDDLKQHVRERFANSAAGSGARSSTDGIPTMPIVDHAQYGPVHEQKLTRIQKVSGPALRRSWLNVPHVTQNDEADVTKLEEFRRDRREAASERGLKLSPLLFAMKAVVVALREHPVFRSSLAPEGDRLIIKDYFHLGIAVDTDQGLVVPVIRDVDQKGIFELAAELTETAGRARAGKLGLDDLRGACFTISSLGGIGGTSFTPIVNAPEVAILGLSRTRVQPVWDGPSPIDLATRPNSPRSSVSDRTDETAPAVQVEEPESGCFVPRLMLPISVSYDHRVIDGAEAARFTSRLAHLLADPIRLLL